MRFGVGKSGVRLSSGSYQDLVNWHGSHLTRRTVCRRAAWNATGLERDWAPPGATDQDTLLEMDKAPC